MSNNNLVYPLPPKENRLFSQLSKAFDNREYDKCVKMADQLLATQPDHGETMAMKGLALHTDGKKDGEDGGFAWAKKGVTKAMKAPICWHSLGMCHRADNQYPEAMKAFRMAHRMEAENQMVLRDISSLAIQLRDWDTFIEMRQKLLNMKSNVRMNWLALSAGHRMKGNIEMAVAIADVMVMIVDAGDTQPETAEIQLYRAELEMLARHPERALKLIKENDKAIFDPIGKLLVRAKAHTMMGQKPQAEKCHFELIEQGYGEVDAIQAIAELRGIALDDNGVPKDSSKAQQYVELLDSVLEKHPKCDAAKRLVLDACPIELFEERLVKYTTPFVTKNIPSLVSVLKSLYRYPERAETIGKVFLRWEEELTAGNFASFGPDQNPTYILWVYTFLSSHFQRLKNYEEAHRYINLAIDHTPTVEMLYMYRAKIYHAEGKVQEAAEAADKARLLDLQDKYLNGKAAKYMFRAGRLEEAEQRMGLFYKQQEVNDHFLTARDSQCIWYEKECGDAEFNRGDVYSALQNYLLYEKHTQDNRDTLIDFHNYTFRKGNVRAWIDIINSDDNFEGRKMFLKLCPRLARAYMKVAELGEEAVRAAYKPREEPPKTENDEENKRFADFNIDVDLSEPMAKAARYVNALVKHRPKDEASHTLAIEFFVSWNKPILAARSLLALHKLGSPKAKELAATVQGAKGSVPAAVAIVDEILKTVNK